MQAAILAPSGDNMQPWRFAVDEVAGVIRITLNEARATSPMDAEHHMPYIAIGAAVENICRTAAAGGLACVVRYNGNEEAVEITLGGLAALSADAIKIESVIKERHTNRSLYDGRQLDSSVAIALRRRAVLEGGVEFFCITSRAQIQQVAELTGQADRIMFGLPDVFEAFVRSVHFGKGAQEAQSGMPVGVLGVSPSQRIALRLASRMHRYLMPNHLTGWVLGRHARRLMQSASGLCVITAPDDQLATELSVGRAVQSAWLELTQMGFSVQPMGSLYLLDHMSRYESSGIRQLLKRKKIESLLARFRQVVPQVESGRLAFLLRFGYGPSARVRTKRLLLEDVLKP